MSATMRRLALVGGVTTDVVPPGSFTELSIAATTQDVTVYSHDGKDDATRFVTVAAGYERVFRTPIGFELNKPAFYLKVGSDATVVMVWG